MSDKSQRRPRVLREAETPAHKLGRPLLTVRISMFIEPGTYIPDLLTRVRVLETVASVTQDREFYERANPDARPVDASLSSALPTNVDPLKGAVSTSGRDVVNVLVRYLPKTVTVGEAVKELAERVRALPGVRRVRFDEMSGRPLTVGGKPVVF
jgi:hypothetical protein